MIAVVADDLTGAAELAGIAWSHGLTAEVQTEFSPDTSSEVVALDAKSRDFSADIAVKWTAAAFRSVAAAQPEWIYKKCDSVLRGHVAEEIEGALAVTGLPRALLIPANPSRGRIIRGGEYFVGERKLEETDFANDPHYPRRTSTVCELLGGRAKMLRADDSMGATGIFVPDVESVEQLGRWAASMDATTLPAGAADFFESILVQRLGRSPQLIRSEYTHEVVSTLFVCGSAMAWREGRAKECLARNIRVFVLGRHLDWLNASHWAKSALDRAGTVMIACGDSNSADSDERHNALIYAARDVVQNSMVQRVCVEGGATALSLAALMGWSRFEVVREWAPGVVELRPIGAGRMITMIVKVGSYLWPRKIWPK